jgi:hypothetical protein
MSDNIKTQAGQDMFKYFNDNYGSSVWGKVLEGIKAIEKELSPNPQIGYSTGKWSDDDDWSPITPIFGPNR